jgi:endonuclease YncB( thermonuclease family)
MSSKYYATVTRVIDGDTFQVKDKFGNTQTIRLFGVDTPEKKQPFGMTATEFTKKLIDKKEVHVESITLGKYGRVVAIVHINGRSLGEILVAEGIAFADGENHRLAHKYYALQEKARVNNQGVHKLGIQKPSEFRKQNQRVRNPTFGRSNIPAPIPVPRFRPSKPKLLDQVTKFFHNLFEKSEENIAKRAEIKKAELERIEKRIADRKMEQSIRENLEKRQSEKSKEQAIEEEIAKVDINQVLKRFNKKSNKM